MLASCSSISRGDDLIFTQASVEQTSFFSESVEESVEAIADLASPEVVFGGVPNWTSDSDTSSSHKAGHSRRKKADNHAPAGLIGKHLHDKDEWMAEYKYMNMYMDDNLAGETKVGDLASTPFSVNAVTTNMGHLQLR